MTVKEELNQLLLEEGLLESSACTEEEQLKFESMNKNGEMLPEDITVDDGKKYIRLTRNNLNNREFLLLLMIRRNRLLHSIYSCLVVLIACFLVLAAVSLFH